MKQITKEAYEVIFEAMGIDHNILSAKDALEDGEYLDYAGYCDADIELIEEAHITCKDILSMCKRLAVA